MNNVEKASEPRIDSASSSPPIWWLGVIQGVAAILLGIFLLVWPGQTIILVARMIAIYLIVSGILAIIPALNRDQKTGGRIWKLVSGALFVLAGLLIFVEPAVSSLMTQWLFSQAFGLIALVGGFVSVTIAFFKMEGGFRYLVVGVVAILIGGTLLVSPLLSILVVMLIVGIGAIVGGSLLVIGAVRSYASRLKT